MLPRLFTMFLLSLVCLPAAIAEDHWPMFRGPRADGMAPEGRLPEEWSDTKNVAWKTPIPGLGWSSPIVWGKKVFLTTAVSTGEEAKPAKGLYMGSSPKTTNEHRWLVLCLDLETGKILWEKEVHKGVPPQTRHIKNTHASETPVTDGEHVYAYFGAIGGLYCLDMDGKITWHKNWHPLPTSWGWGTGASPILFKDKLLIVNDNEKSSSMMAFNKQNGEELWKIDRQEKSNWATPFVWENKLRTEIVTAGSGRVRSYDLNGKLLWEFKGMSGITIPTPMAKDGLLYVASGYVMDRNKPVYAILPGAKGDITLKEGEEHNEFIVWKQPKAAAYHPSPLVIGEHLYILLDSGQINCFEAKTGKEIYGKQRIHPSASRFTASPWYANGKIFCLSEDGDTFVIQPGPEFKLLGRNTLNGEMCMATPALLSDRLLIRTQNHLFCLKEGAELKTK
jgi:outer membrane protein assembly factor BamB